jgi:uncharacterized Tic20 family protein
VLAEDTPDKEDRLLAACAYLSWVAGLWIIGPVALYFIYRDKSRYVAFHALQAAALAIGISVLAPVAVVVSAAAPVIGAMALGPKGQAQSLGPFMLAFYLVAMALVFVVPMAWMLLGAWRAYHGQRWRVPLAWRVAKRFVEDAPRDRAAGRWSAP